MPSPEPKVHPRRVRRRLVACSVAVLALVAAACATTKEPPPPPPAPGWIATNPTLFPAFTTDIPDYVIKCDKSAPVHISVDAPPDTTVSVNGLPFQGGQFGTEVTRDVGQSFTIVVQAPSGTTTHFVRCLPSDFPDWTAQRTGDTQAAWYVMSTPQTGPTPNYPVIFDHDGVPVWWSAPLGNSFTTVLPNNDVAWTLNTGAGAEEHALDGHLVRTVKSLIPGSGTDIHDLLLLPNGNYVLVGNISVPADLTSCGGSATGSLLDHVIQEIQPGQKGAHDVVVWSWDTMAHIPVSESDPQWQSACATGDAYHWNSIEPTSDGFILSFRHLDAIYRIKKDLGQLDDGTIEWKLGGSARPESLTVQQDPVFDTPVSSHFGGQHDARLLDDGTVTLHDNGSNLGRPPRAVRYQIDTSSKTATLIEQLSDPLMPSSNCCGDARKLLPGGNWVMGWGGSGGDNRVVTEMTADGSRVFLLQFPNGVLYRGTPVPFGQLQRDDLHAGMDAQFGTPPVGTTSAGARPNTAATSGTAPQPPNPLANLP